jgi:hypothetical protein
MPASDPLPFQFLAKNPEKCRNIKFIDVDYTMLMTRKCSVIMETEQLRGLLSGVELPVFQGNVVLRSDQYLAVGCDLRELDDLERTLVGEVDIENCLVLFTAEVSVTYMEVEAADALIKWAAGFHSCWYQLSLYFRLYLLTPKSIQRAFVFLNSSSPMDLKTHLQIRCCVTSKSSQLL